jgi:hypothetical protein
MAETVWVSKEDGPPMECLADSLWYALREGYKQCEAPTAKHTPVLIAPEPVVISPEKVNKRRRK